MTSKMDVIVAGPGRVGSQTAEHLANRGHNVTVIERDSDVVSDVADEWYATVIHGDATEPDILRQAGVEDADAVAALTGETGLNLAICMISERISSDIRTVARVERDVGDSYLNYVDGVVFPERAGSRVAVNEVCGTEVQTLADLTGDLDVMVITVEEGSPAAGRSLEEVKLPQGSLVVSDKSGDRISRRDTVLEPGHSYIVAAEDEVVDEVLNILRG